MALNALVDSFSPESEKVWDWQGYRLKWWSKRALFRPVKSQPKYFGHMSRYTSLEQASRGLWGSTGFKMPIFTPTCFRWTTLTSKVRQTDVVSGVHWWFIGRSVHARLRVSMCRCSCDHPDTQRQTAFDQLIWIAQGAELKSHKLRPMPGEKTRTSAMVLWHGQSLRWQR